MHFMFIETRKREKQLKMPAKSKPLGYNCPKCGLDYGSESIYRPIKLSKKIYNNNGKRQKSQKNKVEDLTIPKRSTPKPIEYTLLRDIIYQLEEGTLDRFCKILLSPKREMNPDSETKQSMLRLVRGLRHRIETRDKYLNEEKVKDTKWDVVIEPDEIDFRIYKIMVIMNGIGIFGTELFEEIKNGYENAKKDGNVNENYHKEKDKITIRWNPIKQIKEYRRNGDILRHIYIPPGFLAKALVIAGIFSNNNELLQYITGEKKPLLEKACKLLDKYRKPFVNNNWFYTWFEWFWIIAYADVFTPGKAVNMLKELDGVIDGKISTKYIRIHKQKVLDFWEEFLEYAHYLFKVWNLLPSLNKYAPGLKQRYKETVSKKVDDDNKKYMERITDELGQAMLQQYYYGNDSSTAYEDTVNRLLDSYGQRDADTHTSPVRIKITHSNPNYKKEMEEYRKKQNETTFNIRQVKPKKKTQCIINPWRDLPQLKLAELLEHRKLSI
jgi:hypothetical protein